MTSNKKFGKADVVALAVFLAWVAGLIMSAQNDAIVSYVVWFGVLPVCAVASGFIVYLYALRSKYRRDGRRLDRERYEAQHALIEALREQIHSLNELSEVKGNAMELYRGYFDDALSAMGQHPAAMQLFLEIRQGKDDIEELIAQLRSLRPR